MKKIFYALLVLLLAVASIIINHIGADESGSKAIFLEIVHITSHLILAGVMLVLAIFEKYSRELFQKYQITIQKTFGFLTGVIMAGVFFTTTSHLYDGRHIVDQIFAVKTVGAVTLLSLIQIFLVHKISGKSCDLPCHDGVRYHLIVDVFRNVLFVVGILFFNPEQVDILFSIITGVIMLGLTLRVFYRSIAI